METIKVKSWDDIPGDFTGVAEFLNHSFEWFKEGKLHRVDGPAVESAKGIREWWIEGKRHRIDGPAVEYPDGDKFWYIENRNYHYSPIWLQFLIESSVFLGKEKGKYNLEWLRFLTEEGIKEFPIIPGMETYEDFISLLGQLFAASKQ